MPAEMDPFLRINGKRIVGLMVCIRLMACALFCVVCCAGRERVRESYDAEVATMR